MTQNILLAEWSGSQRPGMENYLLQVVTMAWGKSKRDRGLHWPSTSFGAARKGLTILCAGIGYAKWFWEEGRCCQHMDGGKMMLSLQPVGNFLELVIVFCSVMLFLAIALPLLRIVLLEKNVISWHWVEMQIFMVVDPRYSHVGEWTHCFHKDQWISQSWCCHRLHFSKQRKYYFWKKMS